MRIVIDNFKFFRVTILLSIYYYNHNDLLSLTLVVMTDVTEEVTYVKFKTIAIKVVNFIFYFIDNRPAVPDYYRA